MARTSPAISVIERRLQGQPAEVFRASSQPIPLKEPKQWTVRWVNADVSEQHLWDMLNHKGWIYAEVNDLACPPAECGATVVDGKLVRGVRGREFLMKMRVKDYKAVQQAKDVETRRQTFGAKQIKNAIVSGVTAEHGDQAAEYVHRHVNTIEVTDSRERVSLDD